MAKGIIRKRSQQDTGDSPEGTPAVDYSDQAAMQSYEDEILSGKPEPGIHESGVFPSQQDMASTAKEYDPMFGEIPNMEYETPASFTVGSLRKLRMPGAAPNKVRYNIHNALSEAAYDRGSKADHKTVGMLNNASNRAVKADEALYSNFQTSTSKSYPGNRTTKTISKEAIQDIKLKPSVKKHAQSQVDEMFKGVEEDGVRKRPVYHDPGIEGANASLPAADGTRKSFTYARKQENIPHEDIHRQMADSLSSDSQKKLEEVLESRMSESSNNALNNILKRNGYKETEYAGEKMNWINDMFGEYGSLKDKKQLKNMSGLGPEEWEDFKRDARRAYNQTVKDINSKKSRAELEAWIKAEHESGFMPLGDAAESGIAAARKKK
jgi:hypothetical protein